ncbi:MAG: tRNA isopentenyl-2-thiomethyl-A-37 hydroxylase MiaE, partial [Halieaceae bacterium]
ARSCERFAALVPVLDDELAAFYASLLKSESRHYQDYLRLARAQSTEEELANSLDKILAVECDLIERDDSEFRFHSGPPVR